MQQVLVNIAEDGSVTVEANGVKGQACDQLTKAIENAIGERVSDRKKAEYFQPSQAGNAQTAGR